MLPWSCLDKVFSFLLLPVCLLYFYLQFLYFSSFSSILSRYYWIRCWSISWRWRHWWIAICSGEPFIRNWMPRWYVQLTIEFWNWDNYWWWACFSDGCDNTQHISSRCTKIYEWLIFCWLVKHVEKMYYFLLVNEIKLTIIWFKIITFR